MAARLFIGTSGWHYKHWRGPFYPEKLPASEMLAFYVRHFDTVELNNSFYKLPDPASLAGWRENTPSGFCFAAKGSRYLTHMKKLKDPAAGIEKYFSRIDLLGDKLGPILFQLAPFWERNSERLQAFLEALPSGHRYAFEFRNPTWHCTEIYSILERHNAAWCSFDLAGFQSPVLLTADWTYVRLHGPGAAYQGSYGKEALTGWAKQLRAWMRKLTHVYCFFDNDMAGYAAHNALQLKSFMGYWE